MLFIGMICFTGINAAVDLTTNSELAFDIDNDVGYVGLLILAENVYFVEVRTEVVQAPYQVISYPNRNYGYIEYHQICILGIVKPPDLITIFGNNSKGNKWHNNILNRSPRDAL